MAATKRIDESVLHHLREVHCEGCNAKLVGQLDRADYVKVNKVLEALGGKWSRKDKAHVFPDDAAELIGDVVTSGEYIDRKQEFQFFDTPDSLALELADSMRVSPESRVLEPSAGSGRLVKRLLSQCGVYVVAAELDGKHHKALSDLGAEVHIVDFLATTPDSLEGPFDGVLMNPPFTKSQDIKHVRHAFTFLKPGAELVAIMSIGFTFRQDRVATEFLEWLEDNEGTWTENEPGAFKSSGTMVNTVTVRVMR